MIPRAGRPAFHRPSLPYCQLDTLAMVWLTDKLRELVA